MSAAVTLTALAAEAALGYPSLLLSRIGHPVTWLGALIGWLELRLNRRDASNLRRRLWGMLTILMVGAAAAAPAALLGLSLDAALDGPTRLVALALLAAPGLAQRSLYEHVSPVQAALAGGDVAKARSLVAQIVGRDTENLDETGVARAAVESLAESFNDAVVAPAFWLLVGGLPGLYLYKAVNTADSMIGHRDDRFEAFGWAAARADDLLNLVPARVAGLLICVSAGRGLSTMIRDAPKHASPNAGWPEAAMAGALGVRLGGPASYDGVAEARPWFGTGERPVGPQDVRAALRLYLRACAVLWILLGVVAWLL